MAFCPATMCPFFAPDGSPWTGDKNGTCERDHEKCAWYWKDGCTARPGSMQQIVEFMVGGRPLMIGVRPKMEHMSNKPMPACDREKECQWQIESGDGPCPPRFAIMNGVDPRMAGY